MDKEKVAGQGQKDKMSSLLTPALKHSQHQLETFNGH